MADPVGDELVASLARPGGNVTGTTFVGPELIAKARRFVDVGGLMSYGANLPDLFRRSATYVDKILKGVMPADLPVEQPTKFEFVINLKDRKGARPRSAADAACRANEVIE
jgi:ABC-type uncharacterized transport system substrate-binding protein